MTKSNLIPLAPAALLLACACNSPPKESHDGAAVPTVASVSPAASASAPRPATSTSAAPGACSKDDECRTFSSYCTEAPCACRVFAANEPDPTCLGNVRCFADPCMKKTARCQAGACVLTAK